MVMDLIFELIFVFIVIILLVLLFKIGFNQIEHDNREYEKYFKTRK
jgi:hypothetical protein